MSEWIKCKDDFPTDGQRVVFELWRDGEVQAGRYHGEIAQFVVSVGSSHMDFTMGYECRDVKRWQPLPEAPND